MTPAIQADTGYMLAYIGLTLAGSSKGQQLYCLCGSSSYHYSPLIHAKISIRTYLLYAEIGIATKRRPRVPYMSRGRVSIRVGPVRGRSFHSG